MKCARYLIVSTMLLSCPAVPMAAELVFAGPVGAPIEQAAESLRAQLRGFDGSAALPTTAAVLDAVTTGRAAGGMILANTAMGIPSETAKLLLNALDPGVRIVAEARVADSQAGPVGYWAVVRTSERPMEQHPDRLVVNIDAPPGSKALSLVVAALSKLGFTVTGVTSAPLPGKPFGFRYLLTLVADKPVLVLRLTDAVARDSRTGEGRAVVIGAWRQMP